MISKALPQNISEIVVKNVKNVPQRIIYYKTILLEVWAYASCERIRSRSLQSHFHFPLPRLSTFSPSIGAQHNRKTTSQSPFEMNTAIWHSVFVYKWARIRIAISKKENRERERKKAKNSMYNIHYTNNDP